MNPKISKNIDYRTSHLNKAQEYNDTFINNPLPHMVWRWEKKVLDQAIIDHIPSGNRMQYLDFACGTGRILTYLEQHFVAVTGVDVSANMLEIARIKTRKSELILTDIVSGEAEQNIRQKFDLITAFRFFVGAEDELRSDAIKTLSVLLNDNGILIFNNHRNYHSLTYRLFRIYSRRRKQVNNIRCLTDSEANALCKSVGLQIIETYHWGILPALEHRMFLHPNIQKPLENFFSRLTFFSNISTYKIYICKRA